MADFRKPDGTRFRARSGHGSRTVWELAGFIAGLLLALLSAPFFWI